MKSLVSFSKNVHGAVAIEYGLIALLIGIAAIVTFAATGTSIIDIYESTATDLCAAVSDVVPVCG